MVAFTVSVQDTSENFWTVSLSVTCVSPLEEEWIVQIVQMIFSVAIF